MRRGSTERGTEVPQEMKVLTVERSEALNGMKKAEYIELLGIRHDEPARWMKAMPGNIVGCLSSGASRT